MPGANLSDVVHPGVVGQPQRVRIRPRLRSRLTLVCALLVVLVTLPATPSQGSQPSMPQVRDPFPAPGSVIDAGPVVAAARIVGADSADVQLLLDGIPVDGPRADPDGDLTELDGWEVTLTPGVHQLAIAVDGHGIVREWEVVAAGVRIFVTDQDAQGLASRFARTDTGPPPSRAIVVNVDQPELAVAAGPLAAALDAVVVPLADDTISPEGWVTLDTVTGDVILLGDQTVISEHINGQLTDVGKVAVRVPGTNAQEVAANAAELIRQSQPQPNLARALIIAPASPFAAALQAAIAAVNLDTAFVLVGDDEIDETTRQIIADHQIVLLSTALSPGARQAAVQALEPSAVASDDDLQPAAAQEAVLVADTTNRGQAAIVATTSHPDRPVLLGSTAGADWMARARPGRMTIVVPQQPATALADVADASLPAIATAAAIDADAEALVLPTPVITPDEGPRIQDPEELFTQLRQAWVDGRDRLRVEALLNPADPVTITLSLPAPITDAAVHVSALGYEWPGTVAVQDGQATWTSAGDPELPLPLQSGGLDAPTPIEITTTVTAATSVMHQRFDTVVGLDPGDTVSAEGWIVAGGSDPQIGTGALNTYSVEVEPQTGLDIDEVQDEVTAILSDQRSWIGDGSVSFRRVGLSQSAQVRVVVARPDTVDAFCGRAGLRTGGQSSCWDGYRAMLNLDRWNTGVTPFHTDMDVYRQYLVNHEVGHGLSHGHEYCTAPGTLAPVMMQQTGGIGSCLANGWPFPTSD